MMDVPRFIAGPDKGGQHKTQETVPLQMKGKKPSLTSSKIITAYVQRATSYFVIIIKVGYHNKLLKGVHFPQQSRLTDPGF